MGVNETGVLLGPADGDQAEIVATPMDHMVQMVGDATSTLRRTTCSAPGESRFPFAKMCATFPAESGYYTDLAMLPPETVFGVVASLLQRGEAAVIGPLRRRHFSMDCPRGLATLVHHQPLAIA